MPTEATALTVFDFHDHPVRTIMVDGAPWFVGKDVCRCLGIVDYHQAISRLADDEKRGGCIIPTPGGDQAMLVVGEPGVYRLIFESRKPEAERFRRWVFHEVLPALRKTGSYTLGRAEIEAMKERVELVREARRIAGPAAARDLWQRLGLPPLDVAEPDRASRPAEGLAAYVADFLDEMTEADPAARVRSTALHEAYLEWSRSNRAPYIMASVFGRFLVQAGLRKVKSNGQPFYLGLRVRTA